MPRSPDRPQPRNRPELRRGVSGQRKFPRRCPSATGPLSLRKEAPASPQKLPLTCGGQGSPKDLKRWLLTVKATSLIQRVEQHTSHPDRNCCLDSSANRFEKNVA